MRTATLRAEIAAAATMANFIWRLERNAHAAKAMIAYVRASVRLAAARGNVAKAPAYVQDFAVSLQRTIVVIGLEQDASLDGQRQLQGFVPVATKHALP